MQPTRREPYLFRPENPDAADSPPGRRKRPFLFGRRRERLEPYLVRPADPEPRAAVVEHRDAVLDRIEPKVSRPGFAPARDEAEVSMPAASEPEGAHLETEPSQSPAPEPDPIEECATDTSPSEPEPPEPSTSLVVEHDSPPNAVVPEAGWPEGASSEPESAVPVQSEPSIAEFEAQSTGHASGVAKLETSAHDPEPARIEEQPIAPPPPSEPKQSEPQPSAREQSVPVLPGDDGKTRSYLCPICGEIVDKSDLAATLYHQRPNHRRDRRR
jgi:hypothetical protein